MSRRVRRARSSASSLADSVGDGEEQPGLCGHLQLLHPPAARPPGADGVNARTRAAAASALTGHPTRTSAPAIGRASGSTSGALTAVPDRLEACVPRPCDGRGVGGLDGLYTGVAAQAPERPDELVDVVGRQTASAAAGVPGANRRRSAGLKALGGRVSFLSGADPDTGPPRGARRSWSSCCARVGWYDFQRAYLSQDPGPFLRGSHKGGYGIR